MSPQEYLKKTYRVIIEDENIQSLICLPSSNQSHGEIEIPKNSIVEIKDYLSVLGNLFFVVEYAGKHFFVTEYQIEQFFKRIRIRG